MLDELQKEKQKLAEMQDTSIDKISVPISTQLEILTKEVGVMKGKTIRGLGYGPQRETICNHANHSKTDLYTTEELLSAMGQMALQIEQLEAKFAAYVKQNTSPPCDDGIGEDDEEIDGEDSCDDGIGEDDEEMDEEDEEEDLGYMH